MTTTTAHLTLPPNLQVCLIVATDRNRAIGRDNTIPWRHRGDMSFFRHTTTGHVVLMGRKTFESLDSPLRNRVNLVLTSQVTHYPPADPPTRVEFATGIQQALQLAWEHAVAEGGEQRHSYYPTKLFVIGGQTLYEQFLPYVHCIYHNVLDLEVQDADTFFPELPEGEWIISNRIQRPAQGEDVSWKQNTYVRRPR